MEQKPYIITITGPESSGKSTLARQLAARLGCPWVPEYAREYLDNLGREYNESDLAVIAEGQLEAIREVMGIVQPAVLSPGSLILRPAIAHPSVTTQQPGENTFVGKVDAGSQQPVVSSEKLAGGSPERNLENHGFLTFHREDFGDEPRPVFIIDSGMMGMRMWAKIKYKMTIPVVEEILREDMTSMYILCRPVLPWTPDPLRESPLLLERAWIYNQFLKEIFLIQSK